MLSRSGVHTTTKIHGKYRKDPKGPHATLCYKDEGQIQRGTHVASHSYVKSMADWTYVSASHDPEKPDSVLKSNKEEVWPASDELEEITPIAYSHLAEHMMRDWAEVSDNSLAGHSDQTAYVYGSLAAGTASMTVSGESSRTGARNQESVIVDFENDTYVTVEKKDSKKFTLRLLDESTLKTQATGWQQAHVLYNGTWKPCYLYVGRISRTRYWTWTLELGNNDKGKGKESRDKGKESKDKGKGRA